MDLKQFWKATNSAAREGCHLESGEDQAHLAGGCGKSRMRSRMRSFPQSTASRFPLYEDKIPA